jgi:hypothetical protein
VANLQLQASQEVFGQFFALRIDADQRRPHVDLAISQDYCVLEGGLEPATEEGDHALIG